MRSAEARSVRAKVCSFPRLCVAALKGNGLDSQLLDYSYRTGTLILCQANPTFSGPCHLLNTRGRPTVPLAGSGSAPVPRQQSPTGQPSGLQL